MVARLLMIKVRQNLCMMTYSGFVTIKIVRGGASRFSLRLGHAHVLTVHRTVIHYVRAASLRRPEKVKNPTNKKARGFYPRAGVKLATEGLKTHFRTSFRSAIFAFAISVLYGFFSSSVRILTFSKYAKHSIIALP